MPGKNEDKKPELLNRILKEKCDYKAILKAAGIKKGSKDPIEWRCSSPRYHR